MERFFIRSQRLAVCDVPFYNRNDLDDGEEKWAGAEYWNRTNPLCHVIDGTFLTADM